MTSTVALRKLPAVDLVLRTKIAAEAAKRFGRQAVVAAVRKVLAEARAAKESLEDPNLFAGSAVAHLNEQAKSKLLSVFNLTGTVLHTNLGRALLAEAAIDAATSAMRNAVALEFDLGGGKRGDRDDVVRDCLCELTGAEDATIVNNNAAAILLVLNTIANRREAIVSRGELIEIGGAFRMPEIMSRAGARLVEVGTTNRTHRKDYAAGIGSKTGLILKVHTSNYRIEGFTKEVTAKELAVLARKHNVPLVNDVGSGTLVDLTRFGVGHEPTVREALADGADLVTFSGDKLLGGPQAGFVVGRKELIARLNVNPMKRALRIDKIRLAAVEATLNLYRDPDRLAERLPTVRMLSRPKTEIQALARRLISPLVAKLTDGIEVSVVPCRSQIGSGALPLETVESAGLAMRAVVPSNGRARVRVLTALSSALRRLPIPVLGRIEGDALVLDLRCLEDEAGFISNLAALS